MLCLEIDPYLRLSTEDTIEPYGHIGSHRHAAIDDRRGTLRWAFQVAFAKVSRRDQTN